MSLNVYLGSMPAFATEAELYAARPWLKAGSVTREGPHWVGTDERDGTRGIVARLPDAVLQAEAQAITPSTGLVNFGLAKSGENYQPETPVSAALFGGGLLPLPGLGILGDGKARWWLLALLLAGLALAASGKGPRGRNKPA